MSHSPTQAQTSRDGGNRTNGCSAARRTRKTQEPPTKDCLSSRLILDGFSKRFLKEEEMIGAEIPDYGMTAHYHQINREQLAERTTWEQRIIDSDKAELKGIAEEIYKDFAFTNSEEYYRENGFHNTTDKEWQEQILEESTARIKRTVFFREAQQRAISDMAEAMADALENGDDWTTLSWVVAKIKADDERNAKSAEAFDKMMRA